MPDPTEPGYGAADVSTAKLMAYPRRISLTELTRSSQTPDQVVARMVEEFASTMESRHDMVVVPGSAEVELVLRMSVVAHKVPDGIDPEAVEDGDVRGWWRRFVESVPAEAARTFILFHRPTKAATYRSPAPDRSL